MRITMLGAAGEVTGSAALVETDRARLLVDFGLFQGGRASVERNRERPPIDAGRLDAVVVTHAHLDHVGRLPLLPGLGFRGRIHATAATIDLAELILRDSARIQASDAERDSRRLRRLGRDPVEPLYGEAEVERILPAFAPVPYDEPVEIAEGVVARWRDAGHILGAASIELRLRDGGSEKRVVFSGDVGPHAVPLLRDPRPFEHADLVVLESTYGDRDHRSREETTRELADVVKNAIWEREKVLVPSFAIGRAQELLWHLGEIIRDELVPSVPVHLDSPMAIEASELYLKHAAILDEEARALLAGGAAPMLLPELHLCRTTEESRALNDVWSGAIVIAGAGMCTGGRILHHLRHNLWRRNVRVLFVGYQAEGTLGRRLVDGAKHVRIHGSTIAVRAEIATLGGLSAHAGRSGLLAWYAAMAADRPRTILNHGEDRPRAALAEAIRAAHGVTAACPGFGETIEL